MHCGGGRPASTAVAVPADCTTDSDSQPPTKRFKGNDTLHAYLADSDDDDGDDDSSATAGETLQAELERYDASKIVHQDGQPIDFWKSANTQYPLLSVVAYKLLAIPATSVPSERLFSTAGLVVSKLRASTSPENAAKILVLNKNIA